MSNVVVSDEHDISEVPREILNLCKKMNLCAEDVTPQALSLLNVSVQLQEKGFRLEASKHGFFGREVRVLSIRR